MSSWRKRRKVWCWWIDVVSWMERLLLKIWLSSIWMLMILLSIFRFICFLGIRRNLLVKFFWMCSNGSKICFIRLLVDSINLQIRVLMCHFNSIISKIQMSAINGPSSYLRKDIINSTLILNVKTWVWWIRIYSFKNRLIIGLRKIRS